MERSKRKRDTKWASVHTLTAQLARKHGVTHALAQMLVRDFFEEVGAQVLAKRSVLVPRFGVFTTSTRKARIVRDLVSGEMIDLPSTRSLALRPSTHFRGIAG